MIATPQAQNLGLDVLRDRISVCETAPSGLVAEAFEPRRDMVRRAGQRQAVTAESARAQSQDSFQFALELCEHRSFRCRQRRQRWRGSLRVGKSVRHFCLEPEWLFSHPGDGGAQKPGGNTSVTRGGHMA
jgi:hypothetical protein